MYHKVNFKLTESQHKKVIHANNNGLGIRLKLSKSMITPSGTTILLTNNEMNKLQDGGIHTISISSSRVQKMGGFLPILPILGGIGALTGIVTSIINSVKSSKASAAQAAAAQATEELAKERLRKERF
jgi:VIT1/CCC1 family predicted Fe2+/Mn2+ transporter